MKYPTNFGLLLVHFILLLQQHVVQTQYQRFDLKVGKAEPGGASQFLDQQKQVCFQQNTQSRFASVVLDDGVLGPLHLA